MRLRRKLRFLTGPARRAVLHNAAWLHRYWPGQVWAPVFVVGCPRSGTTVFGQLLGQWPGVLYLNEPRYLWCQAEPRLDIWAYRYPIEQGVLSWGAADGDARLANRLRRWFHLELFAGHQRCLVEKSPENVFRMLWLNQVFPEARFVHLIRHGRDVALSLRDALKRWFPAGYWEASRHFGIFRDYASGKPDLQASLACIPENTDNYARALFVWLCSVKEGRRAGSLLGPGQYCEVRYEALVAEPERELGRLFQFLQAEGPVDGAIRQAGDVLRAASVGKADPDQALTRAIAGDLLDELGYALAPA
jgi:hypothetical protein